MGIDRKGMEFIGNKCTYSLTHSSHSFTHSQRYSAYSRISKYVKYRGILEFFGRQLVA